MAEPEKENASLGGVGSIGGSLGSYIQENEGYTLEEDAARRDAVAMASKPDPPPIISVEPMIEVGMLQPPAGFESTLYLPVERQEQLTIQNLGICFTRLDLGAPNIDSTHLITDIKFVETQGTAEPITVHLGPKYTLMPQDILASGNAGDAKHVFLAVKSEPASTCSEAPIVDLAVIYGGTTSSENRKFETGGGYDTVDFPAFAQEAYGSVLHLALKREGAGAEFAEQLAARAAAEAAEAMDNESNFGGSTVGQLENDLDDELLDTSLTPAQIRDLEEKRAKDMRDRALRLEAAEEEQRSEAVALEVRKEVAAAIKRRDIILTQNSLLQRKVAALITRHEREETENRSMRANNGNDGEKGDERAYGDLMNRILETEERHKSMSSEYERLNHELQARLDEKEVKAADIYDTFSTFKTQIAVQAQHSRTGKSIGPKVIERFRVDEREKDDEASRVRLRNVNLRMMVKKLESQLRAKEQLAEGLHLIDFEQLKIENQALNEKIEERTAELFKLRKKKTASVEVLSHVKEKLYFTERTSGVTKSELAVLEKQVGDLRTALSRHKREREALRRSNAGSSTDSGFTKSDRLVLDFEARKKALASIKDKIQEAKDKYRNLAAFVEGASD